MLTIDELLSETRQARRDWDEAVKGLSDGDYENSEISKGWSLKDVTGHLATYLRLNVRHVKSYMRRRKLVSMRAKNWYRFNQREVVRLKHEAAPRLKRELESAYDELLVQLTRLSDQDLKACFPSPWSPASGRQVRLGTILRADVSRHLREHARDVRNWRGREHNRPFPRR
jgi:uncharacterized damage-inducible protein DinB